MENGERETVTAKKNKKTDERELTNANDNRHYEGTSYGQILETPWAIYN